MSRAPASPTPSRGGCTLLGLAFLLAGCQPIPSDCRSRCNGCCTFTGECQSGNSPLSCGDFGESCQRCDLGSACTDGVCVARPSDLSGSGPGGGAAAGGSAGAGGGAAGGGPPSVMVSGCSGGCQRFAPAWTFSDSNPAPTSTLSFARFIDDTSVVACLALGLPNGSTLTPGSRVLVLDRQGRSTRELRRGPQEPCWSLEVAPDRQRVAVGSSERFVLYSLVDGSHEQHFFVGSNATALAFSRDSRSLFLGITRTGSVPRIDRFDLASESALSSADLSGTHSVVDLLLSEDELSLMAATRGFDIDGTNVSSVLTLRSADLSFQSEAGGRTVALARDPRTQGIFRASPTAVMGVPVPGRVVDAAPHPSLPKAVTLHEDGMLRLIDLTNARVEAEVRAHVTPTSVAFSPDGTWVVSTGQQPQLAAFQLVAGTRHAQP